MLFLTNSAAPRILGHFDRLAGQSPFQSFLCLSGDLQCDMECVRIDYRSAATRFAFRRPARPLHRQRPFVPGTIDLLWLEAIAQVSPTHAFDFFWLMEYDVDFTGHWSRFFSAFEDNRSDLIVTRICHRRDCEPWRYWPIFDPPPEIAGEHHMMALCQLARISAPLVAKVGDLYNRSRFDGHYEALLPTLCSHFGMILEDIGGQAFVRGRKWTGNRGRFKANRRGMPTSYFHEDPTAFDRRNKLWHPVKIVASANAEKQAVTGLSTARGQRR